MTTINFVKVGRLVKIVIAGSDIIPDVTIYRETGETDFTRKPPTCIDVIIKDIGAIYIPLSQITFEGLPVDNYNELDDALALLFPEAGGSASTTLIEELILSIDGSFNMDEKKKLVSIAVNNESLTDMNLIFDSIQFTDSIEIELLASKNVDTFINKTFWTSGTVTITGITDTITLLIERT